MSRSPPPAPARHAGRAVLSVLGAAGGHRRDDRPGLRLPRRAGLDHLPAGRGVDQPGRRGPGRGDRPHAPAGARLRRARLRRRPRPRARARSAAGGDPPPAGGRARPRPPRRSPGLIRPEAWLFSAAYLAVAVARRRARPAAVGAGGRGALCCGRSATSSSRATRCTRCTGTRDTRTAACSGSRGSTTSPGTVPRRLGEILREPVLFGAAGRRAAGARLPARPGGPRRGGRRGGARRVLRAGGRGPADPRALPARPRRDPRHLLRGRAPSAGPSSRAGTRGGNDGRGSVR